jgi:hypothetical protein
MRTGITAPQASQVFICLPCVAARSHWPNQGKICQLNRSNEYEHDMNGQCRRAGCTRGAKYGFAEHVAPLPDAVALH